MGTMKCLVHKFVEEKVIEIVPIFMPKISRTKDHKAATMWTKKDFKVIYDKRNVLSDFTTVPYGY